MSNKNNQATKVKQAEAVQEERAHTPSVYTAKIHAIHMGGPVRADLSINVNGVFAVRGAKLVNGENGMYVSLPRRNTQGESSEICLPKTAEDYARLSAVVMDAYHQTMNQMREQALGNAPAAQTEQKESEASAQIPTTVEVSVNTVRMDGPVLADTTVLLNGDFEVRGVRVVNSENGLFVSMPSYKTDNGYNDVCFPVTKEFREQLNGDVLNAYQQTIAEMFEQQASEAPEQGEAPGMTMSM